MKVYVVIEVHFYPEIDGGNEIRGVFSSEEKAMKHIEEIKPSVEYYLNTSDDDDKKVYELVIEEFEMDLA